MRFYPITCIVLAVTIPQAMGFLHDNCFGLHLIGTSFSADCDDHTDLDEQGQPQSTARTSINLNDCLAYGHGQIYVCIYLRPYDT